MKTNMIVVPHLSFSTDLQLLSVIHMQHDMKGDRFTDINEVKQKMLESLNNIISE